MVTTPKSDSPILSYVNGFFDGLRTSNLEQTQITQADIENLVEKDHNARTLGLQSSTVALHLAHLMEKLCDVFVELEVRNAERAEEVAVIFAHDDAWSPYDAEKNPSSTSPSLPAYILPSYEWLLRNLHNPYPSQRVRQELSASTNTEQRLIDAWFVDARRRIGWTALIAKTRSTATLSPNSPPSDGSSSLPATPSETVTLPRRPQNAAGPGRSELKYKTRKDLVTTATAFFRRDDPVYRSNYQLSAEEEMRFTVMKSHAESLYKRQMEPSQLALKVTGQVKQWTPELGEQAKQVKGEERKRKRRTKIKAEPDLEFGEDDRSESKRARLSSPSSPGQSRSSSLTPYDSVSSPSNYNRFSTVDSPSSSASLKRKRAVSESQHELEQAPVSSATKRLRTEIHSSSLARSVSDPTAYVRDREAADITFSGFPASRLASWFETGDPADPFGSKFDPFSPLDPVEIFDSPPETFPSSFALQPRPLSVDLADLSLFSTIPSISGHGSPSTSPSTPALSASGSLTDLSDDEDGRGDDDVDSLFGDSRGTREADASGFDFHTLITHTATEAKNTPPASVLTPADILNSATSSVVAPIPDFAPFDLSITDPSLLNFTDFGLTGFPEIDFGDSQLGLQSGFPGAIEGSYEGNLDALLSAWAPPDKTSSEAAWDVQNWTGVTQLTPTQVTFAGTNTA